MKYLYTNLFNFIDLFFLYLNLIFLIYKNLYYNINNKNFKTNKILF